MAKNNKNTITIHNAKTRSNWKEKELGKLVHIKSGNSPSLFILEAVGKYPYLKVEDLNNCEKYQLKSREYSNEEKLIVPRNSVIFPKRGAAILNNKVRINSVPVGMDSNLMAIYPKSNELFYEYLYYQITFEQLHKLADTSTIPQINNKHIIPYKIPLPPPTEQHAIAKVLSTADAAIHTTEKLIAQKELRKKWLMQQLLTGKKRLKGFEEEWKEYSFDELLKVVKRPVKWDENKLYKLISVRRRSGGVFFREALYGHQIKVKALRDAEVGDFLFSKMQIVHGASAMVTKEFEGAKISGSYIATVAKNSNILNIEYFNWYSKLPYFYHQALISSYGVHIEKMTFDFDTFLQLEMKLPSYKEQTAIVQLLQAADKEISLLKAKAEKLREQKKGLMQVLLTGKVRLKINNIDHEKN